MSDNLKKGWARVAFGDVVTLSRARSSNPVKDGFERFVGLEHLDPGNLKIRRWGNVAEGTTFTNVFRHGQVLFGKRRAYQRKVALADFEGVCSGDIFVFEARRDFLLPELLPFICQTDRFFAHAVGTSAGSLSPRTNWESLADFEFALPSLDEQWRVAQALGAFQHYRDLLQPIHQKVILVLDALTDFVMDNFAGNDKMSTVCEINAEVLSRPQLESEESWEYADLSSITFPLRLQRLQRICLRNAPSRAQRVAREGDILVSTVRPNLKGHTILSGKKEAIVASTGFTVLRPLKPEYSSTVMGLILSSRFAKYCEKRKTGTAYPAIHSKDVAEFPVPSFDIMNKRGILILFDQLIRQVILSYERHQECSNIVQPIFSNKVLSL